MNGKRFGETLMDKEKLIAAAAAAIAEELKTDIRKIKVKSFKEVEKSNLEKYIEEKSISYKKYQLEVQS